MRPMILVKYYQKESSTRLNSLLSEKVVGLSP